MLSLWEWTAPQSSVKTTFYNKLFKWFFSDLISRAKFMWEMYSLKKAINPVKQRNKKIIIIIFFK